jgi:hypothetical protein
MQFLSHNMGVVCTGGNEVVVFRREYADNSETWTILQSLSVFGDNPAILVAASLGVTGNHADILCAEIKKPGRQEPEVGVVMYKWVRPMFKTEGESMPLKIMSVACNGVFESKSLAMYAAFQHQQTSDETQLLFISETAPLVSEATPPVDSTPSSLKQGGGAAVVVQDVDGMDSRQHRGLGYLERGEGYAWTQTDADLTITLELSQDVGKRDISCVVEPGELVVGLTDGTTLLRGDLMHHVDPEASNWTIEGNRCVPVLSLKPPVTVQTPPVTIQTTSCNRTHHPP